MPTVHNKKNKLLSLTRVTYIVYLFMFYKDFHTAGTFTERYNRKSKTLMDSEMDWNARGSRAGLSPPVYTTSNSQIITANENIQYTDNLRP